MAASPFEVEPSDSMKAALIPSSAAGSACAMTSSMNATRAGRFSIALWKRNIPGNS